VYGVFGHPVGGFHCSSAEALTLMAPRWTASKVTCKYTEPRVRRGCRQARLCFAHRPVVALFSALLCTYLYSLGAGRACAARRSAGSARRGWQRARARGAVHLVVRAAEHLPR
jgi:hypothetical protein